jgi:predicted ATPase/DNA-binding SARP family transcriptional activator
MPSLRLLGAASWRGPDGTLLTLTASRRHQVLALLGYEADWVSRDRLATLFWPGRPAAAARANLRKVLHELRALGVSGLEDTPAGLRWLPDSDVGAFEQARSRGHWQAAADTEAGPLMPQLDEGPQEPEPGFADWLRAERVSWHGRWREAVLKAAALGDARRAWHLAERLLALDALDEDAVALALRAGAALKQPELTQALWQRYVQALRQELGVPPSAALQLLAAGTPGELPPLSPLVGRAAELAALCAMLAGARLVTVFGPGGVGKSRLARHAADAVASRFGRGVVLVPLEDALAPAELPARVAAALGLTGLALAGTANPVQALAHALAAQSLLLVLDGFEAVIDAGPAVLRLLAGAPALRVLATSRERLALDGEWLLPLQGLATPAAGADAAEALATPAAALFVARARAVNPAFDATGAAHAVATICRHLDGLPLALELAASWLRLMPAEAIAAELAGGSTQLLEQGSGLQALFERSWALLTAAERDAHVRLAVFHGGFTRDAAQQVADVGVGMLAALLDKSMLGARADGRLGLHALLLQQARRRLAGHAEADALRERHSRWYLALTRQPSADLAQEHDNLLAAWQQALARNDAAAVRAVLFTLPWAAIVRGRLDGATTLLGQAAAALGRTQPAGAQLLALQAWMLLWQERRPEATQLARDALATLHAKGRLPDDVPGVVMALRTLGHAARMDGRFAEAAAHLAEGVAQARDAGLPAIEAVMLDGQAMALNLLGRHAEARAAVQAAMALNREVGDAVQRMYNLYNLAQSHSLAGDAAIALGWAEQALDTAQRIGNLYFVPYVCLELVRVHLALGRPALAVPPLQRARRMAADHQDGSALASAQEATARVALARAMPPPRGSRCCWPPPGACNATTWWWARRWPSPRLACTPASRRRGAGCRRCWRCSPCRSRCAARPRPRWRQPGPVPEKPRRCSPRCRRRCRRCWRRSWPAAEPGSKRTRNGLRPRLDSSASTQSPGGPHEIDPNPAQPDPRGLPGRHAAGRGQRARRCGHGAPGQHRAGGHRHQRLRARASERGLHLVAAGRQRHAGERRRRCQRDLARLRPGPRQPLLVPRWR